MSSFLVIKKNLDLSAGTGAKILVGKQNRAIPAPPSFSFSFRYVRMNITKRRSSDSDAIQFSRIDLLDSGDNIFQWPNSASVTCTIQGQNSTGNNNNENPNKIIDGSVSTKYCQSWSGDPIPCILTIDLGSENTINLQIYSKWRWYTAGDRSDRDPVSFKLEASNDNQNWIELDSATDVDVTTTRQTIAYTGNIMLPNGNSNQDDISQETLSDYVIVTTMKKHFDFGISYDIDSANGQPVSSFQAKFPSGKYDPLSAVPSYTHHRFLGWHTQANDASNEYAITSGDQKTSNDNVDCFIPALYGNWQAATSVTLSSQMQGWNPEMDHDCFVGQQYGQLPSQAQYQNYRFLGWYTQQRTPDKTTTTAGNHITSTSLVSYRPTLYALWQLPITINFDANGGTLSSGQSVGYYYVDQQLETLPKPTHSSLNFGGWYTLSSGGTKVIASTTAMIGMDNSTLYAQYVNTTYELPNLGDDWELNASLNPNPSLYDGCYQSFSNVGVDDSDAVLTIKTIGYSTFKFYLRSYAESNYDYCYCTCSTGQVVTSSEKSVDELYYEQKKAEYEAQGYYVDCYDEGGGQYYWEVYDVENDWELIDSGSFQSSGDPSSTQGKQNSDTSIDGYQLMTYEFNDPAENYIYVHYVKDGSVAEGEDRGYVLIPYDQD